MTKRVGEGSSVDIIIIILINLDSQKTFDKVPHQRPILKVKCHGMRNSTINWIDQWMTVGDKGYLAHKGFKQEIS